MTSRNSNIPDPTLRNSWKGCGICGSKLLHLLDMPLLRIFPIEVFGRQSLELSFSWTSKLYLYRRHVLEMGADPSHT